MICTGFNNNLKKKKRSDSTVALITEQQLKVLLEECSNELNEQSQNK
jgi:hypothetical protein